MKRIRGQSKFFKKIHLGKMYLLVNFFLYFLVIVDSVYSQHSAEFKIDESEQLFNLVTKIKGYRIVNQNGKTTQVVSIGSGFFFEFDFGLNKKMTCLVTNKHVVENCDFGDFELNSMNNDGSPNYGDILKIRLKNYKKLWLYHPSEDLAILPITPLLNLIAQNYKRKVYLRKLIESYIPNEQKLNELTAIEDVFMIGYPKGFSDSINNIPILRRGTTATPVFINYNKKPQFLLDISIYAGSSGSPILIYNPISYVDKKTNSTMFGKRFYFLGIAVESREYEAKGTAISKNGSQIIETRTWLPFGIAIGIKSSELLIMKKYIESRTTDSYIELYKSSLN
ncbi:trypsin-like peptidase domain-containing protein [Sediminibacterium roseum]|uniref:Trypsin-like peptidase domain-containing protein n=1 Tax=Sediminibacterium roseum TaxID=1978412 RepID=A0ABW9ZY55_9BACT|nr:serine protease [Sediminibacterium roseum]NCI52112.1 trypsin-like peptidase domain-containing protein [Sediminibacterium roseum]